MIKQYNKSMGGTDAMDGQFATYHPMVRNRKWYWPFFIFFLKTCIYNSWHLHRQLGVLDPLLGHIRAITRALLHQFTKNKKVDSNGGNIYHNSKVSARVEAAVRYDGKNHFITSSKSKSRCALCGKTTVKMCSKCDVKLHDYCFAAFHGEKS